MSNPSQASTTTTFPSYKGLKDPLQLAAEKGVHVSVDNKIQSGYQISRNPFDPTTPGSPDINPYKIQVRGATNADAIWGAAQVLRELGAGQNVTAGTFCPTYPVRGLHIDAGRRYFSPQMLHDLLIIMSWNRLNQLNLHFSEQQNYRLESLRFPQITSKEALSLEDLKLLREHAKTLGIKILPSFDIPGHLGGVLGAFPWAKLRDGDKEFPEALDITNEKAIELVTEIALEIVDIFDTDTLMIGGDEFIDFGEPIQTLIDFAKTNYGPQATESDAWIGFLNRITTDLGRRGIKTQIWNDGVRVGRIVNPTPGQTINYWTRWGAHMEHPQVLADAQYPLINWDADRLYLVSKEWPKDEAPPFPHPTFNSVWENYEPAHFPDKAAMTCIPGQQGAIFSIWCDDAQALSNEEIFTKVVGPLTAFAQRTWGTGTNRCQGQVEAQIKTFFPEYS